MKKYLLFLGVFFYCCSGYAYSSVDLLQFCKQAIYFSDQGEFYIYSHYQLDNYAKGMVCAGYISAVVADNDDLVALLKLTKKPIANSPVIFCRPADVSLYQIFRIVVKYLEDNPDRLNQPPEILIRQALAQKFKC